MHTARTFLKFTLLFLVLTHATSTVTAPITPNISPTTLEQITPWAIGIGCAALITLPITIPLTKYILEKRRIANLSHAALLEEVAQYHEKFKKEFELELTYLSTKNCEQLNCAEFNEDEITNIVLNVYAKKTKAMFSFDKPFLTYDMTLSTSLEALSTQVQLIELRKSVIEAEPQSDAQTLLVAHYQTLIDHMHYTDKQLRIIKTLLLTNSKQHTEVIYDQTTKTIGLVGLAASLALLHYNSNDHYSYDLPRDRSPYYRY